MKRMKMKMMTALAVSMFALGSSSVFAGAFDLENDLEFGLGVGYNSNFYNLGTSVLGPRAFAAGGGGLEKVFGDLSNDNNCLPDNDNNDDSRSEPETIVGGAITIADEAITCTGGGSGNGNSLNGINIDFKVNYHIFPWLFFRSGFNANIGFGVEHTFSQTFNGRLASLGAQALTAAGSGSITDPLVVAGLMAVGTLNNEEVLRENLTLKTSGLGFEVPILVGFNLIKAENFSGYIAIGINLSFGGYTEELSGNRTSTFSAGEAAGLGGVLPGVEAADLTEATFTTVENKINEFVLGLHWLIGFQYKLSKELSVFTEIKYLSSGIANAEVTGTSIEGADEGNAASNALLLQDDNDLAEALSTPDNLGNANRNTDTVSGFNLSYTRWIVGVSYHLSL